MWQKHLNIKFLINLATQHQNTHASQRTLTFIQLYCKSLCPSSFKQKDPAALE